jgi:hypothetical protein
MAGRFRTPAERLGATCERALGVSQYRLAQDISAARLAHAEIESYRIDGGWPPGCVLRASVRPTGTRLCPDRIPRDHEQPMSSNLAITAIAWVALGVHVVVSILARRSAQRHYLVRL